jgi:uncharacterized protein YktB (UPF0637 family)
MLVDQEMTMATGTVKWFKIQKVSGLSSRMTALRNSSRITLRF